MTKFDASFKQFQKALKRLHEVLGKKKSAITRDSAIKRFELTFDIAWKLAKAYLEEFEGIRCASPKECFREAYRTGLIGYSVLWIRMTDWRNKAVHTYNEKYADGLYRKLPKVLSAFRLLENSLRDRTG